MRVIRSPRIASFLALSLFVLAFAGTALAVSVPERDSSLADLIRYRPGGVIGVRAVAHLDLEETDALRQEWDAFVRDQGGGWRIWIDRRSGLPLLASGRGIAWAPGPGNDLEGASATVDDLEVRAREFLADNRVLLGEWGDQLVLDAEATALRGGRSWKITFRQVVDGVEVENSRYDFHVGHGNLISFGATRWAPVRVSAEPGMTRDEARGKLDEYTGIDRGAVVELNAGSLHLVPVDPERTGGEGWSGPTGDGYEHRLIWRFSFAYPDEPETWVGEVDAHTGQIFAFYDDTRYERVKGYVNPITDDGDCATGGCREPDYPMPFVDYTQDGGPVTYSGDFGLLECTVGAQVNTRLDGPYFRINDVCGAVSETATCDDELDLGVAAGINCNVAPGASAGNTDAARTAYYDLNRVAQKARFFMPDNTWTRGQVTCRTNVNATCNASWSGQINMYRAGGGCGNTGQNQGVLVHEWGHGMDQNDGGGYDNPSEAYADVVAIFEGRDSCVGPGFRPTQMCSGYGDTCLDCTGIRDHDWDARQDHTPATPSGFLTDNCGGGGGACGKQVHCESYVPSESIYDLAVRDLPAMGLDADTAWQLADRLFYSSRPGSGGDVYNCSLPDSDSCSTTSWFHQLRLMDDDDGNLNNGTPHAAAIFAAFDRHDIACGSASDPEHQNSSTCPSLGAPTITARALTNAVELTWDPVADASSYRVYRNEIGCDRGQFPIAEVTGTTYLDDDLANDFPVFYRVEAIGSNVACVGPVSTCLEAAAQPLAGRVKFDQATYGCSNRIGLKVNDANHSSGTMTIDLWSDTEATPETVILTEATPGAGKFYGEIWTTPAAPSADGMLSTANGDVITAEYVDEDDGAGGVNVPRLTTALSDCVFPVITDVHEDNVSGTAARVNWITNEPSDTVLVWGETTPPTEVETIAETTTVHSVQLGGLTECTVYHFEVQSTDPAGNTAVDDNGARYYRFETLGDFGDGLQPCHAGKISTLAPTYSCNDTASFRLVDIDLNTDPLVVETASILVSSTTEIESETVVLTETGPNTSTFTGGVATAPGAPAPDGVVQTGDGDLLTATYLDEDDGAGYPAVSFDSSVLDCDGPDISGLTVTLLTNARGTVQYTTDEQANTVVEWGFTSALGEVESSSNAVLYHETVLSRLEMCAEIHVRVSSTDVYGNTTVYDANGQPFRFHTWDIPGLYHIEKFEDGAPGWTLEGEWETAAPSGIGGSSGLADPPEAYNNDMVLGHDVSGLGAYPGDYEPGTLEEARSPDLDGTGWVNTKVMFQQRMNIGVNDNAVIWMYADGIEGPVWRSDGEAISAASWERIDIDVSGYADGAQVLRVRFQQSADGSGNYSGWNIDDMIFKDSTLPDFAPCGDCAATPSFAGAISATDNNACGAEGVTVTWKRAMAWGTGGGGTYSVYRDTAPGFTPSTGNRIATGLTSLVHNDATAPMDQTLYYLVRAENDETCGTGPNNGGVTDVNTVYVPLQTTSTQPLPGEVTTIRTNLVARTHVRLDWEPAAAAATYRVYRSASPQPETFGLLGETPDTFYEDIGEGTTSNSYYYKIVPVNACGQEGP
jgi:hypothetical protein